MKMNKKHADQDGMLDGPAGVFDIRNKTNNNKVNDMMEE